MSAHIDRVDRGPQTDPGSSVDRISPVLPVTNVEAASHYFRDRLGFTIKLAAGAGHEWAVVAWGASEIVLVPKDWPAGCTVRVDDVDTVSAELRLRAADFESGPTNQEYGRRDFAVHGPDGYQISFWTPLDTATPISSPPDEPGDERVPF